jgi:hypothetical protein
MALSSVHVSNYSYHHPSCLAFRTAGALLSRRFYAAGMELDPDRLLVRDPGTHYEIYSSVPIRFLML